VSKEENGIIVALGGNLPPEQANGLIGVAAGLVEDRARVRTAIIQLDVQKYTEKTDDGTRIVTTRIRSIEIIDGDDDGEPDVLKLMRAKAMRRTGQATLFGEDGPARQAGQDGPDLLDAAAEVEGWVSERPRDEWLDKG
jgi:hypothetical protein